MSTTTAPINNNKYVLKSLEEEIGLFDRKLAHLHNFETFESEEARLVAAGKLSAKRERLVRTLRELTDPAPEVAAASPKKSKTAAKTKTSTRSKTSAKAKTSSTTKDAAVALEETVVAPVHAEAFVSPVSQE